MFVDTHTHIYSSESFPGEEAEKEVRQAIASGVKAMIFPAVDLNSFPDMKHLAEMYPHNIRMAAGIHPTELSDRWKSDVVQIEELIKNGEYIAVGEVGIDLYWDKSTRQIQMEAFDMQADLAVRSDLPLIIHCRNGLDETLEVLKNHPQAKAVFHCFGGSKNDVDRIREVGDYYFGINGIATFKNSGLSEVLSSIGIDRILLESDAPYLAPVPYRGKINRSSYIPLIANRVSEEMNMDIENVGSITTQNAGMLFGAFWE